MEMMVPAVADPTGWENEDTAREIEMMMVPTVADPMTGWSFDPEEGEVIEHFLGPKVRGEQKFHLSFIPELDVYATEPWNLGIEFRHGKNRDAFFCFTRVAPSGASDGRLQRGAGNGTWHACGQRTLIRCNGEVAGQKMTNLKFMLRAKKGGKPVATSWIMHEYRLFKPSIDEQGREMVLNRIQKSGKGLSDDQACLNDDFSTSTANQKQPRKRKRNQMLGQSRAPPSYITGDEEMLQDINAIIQPQRMMQPSGYDDHVQKPTSRESDWDEVEFRKHDA